MEQNYETLGLRWWHNTAFVKKKTHDLCKITVSGLDESRDGEYVRSDVKDDEYIHEDNTYKFKYHSSRCDGWNLMRNTYEKEVELEVCTDRPAVPFLIQFRASREYLPTLQKAQKRCAHLARFLEYLRLFTQRIIIIVYECRQRLYI